MYELRDATEADQDWLYALNRAAMEEYVAATWGSWDEPFQREFFAKLFSPARFQIIVVDGVDVGALEVRRAPERLHLGEIQLLPQFQSRGSAAPWSATCWPKPRPPRSPSSCRC